MRRCVCAGLLACLLFPLHREQSSPLVFFHEGRVAQPGVSGTDFAARSKSASVKPPERT